MTRRVAFALPALLAAAALLGALVGAAVGVTLAAAAGSVVGWRSWRGRRDRLHALTEHINRWVAAPGPPVRLRGERVEEELRVALNALGAAYRAALEEVEHQTPWREDLVASLPAPALLFDRDGHLAIANDAAREFLEIDPSEPITVIQAVGVAGISDAAHEARSTQRTVEVDARLGDREVRARVSPVGEQLLVVVQDRTRERRVEELRRNFVVNASHELKTPAAGIQALAEGLAVAVRGDERASGLVARLETEARRLVRVVHDLLDLRRLEDPAPLERVPVDVAELIRETVADLTARAEARDVTIEVDAPDHLRVAGVRDDLRLIVRNLVSNALQYNRRGGHVDVRLRAEAGRAVLKVRDTGIGIPQQDLHRIFERFYRVDVARSRESGGTGLGLSIVRHAVERHGGQVRAESLLGEGSAFSVTLPIAPSDR